MSASSSVKARSYASPADLLWHASWCRITFAVVSQWRNRNTPQPDYFSGNTDRARKWNKRGNYSGKTPGAPKENILYRASIFCLYVFTSVFTKRKCAINKRKRESFLCPVLDFGFLSIRHRKSRKRLTLQKMVK